MKHLLFCSIMAIVLALCNTTMAAIWNVPVDFATIQDAIDSSLVIDGDRIMVGPGNHTGAIVTKAVEIKGEDGAVIDSGPLLYPSMPCNTIVLDIGFFFSGNGVGSGATISHLKIEGPAFPVFSRGADDVTVTQCTMINPIQGITNWSGNSWEISHNVITDLRSANGGGIGILVGVPRAMPDPPDIVISDNVVSHNKITGTLHVASCDNGGYSGTGIVLYTDFRWNATGQKEVTNTRVVKNKISLVSDTPDIVDVVAIELTDTRDDGTLKGVYDNAVGFNDMRGTVLQLSLTPLDLDEVNKISRNLGENRGHGLHPSAFGPDQD